MKRQGLTVTLGQLVKIKNDLVKQQQELQREIGLENYSYVDYNKKFQINIINKTPEYSDTWEIEDCFDSRSVVR